MDDSEVGLLHLENARLREGLSRIRDSNLNSRTARWCRQEARLALGAGPQQVRSIHENAVRAFQQLDRYLPRIADELEAKGINLEAEALRDLHQAIKDLELLSRNPRKKLLNYEGDQ